MRKRTASRSDLFEISGDDVIPREEIPPSAPVPKTEPVWTEEYRRELRELVREVLLEELADEEDFLMAST